MTGLEALKKLDFYSDSYSANSEYLNIIAKELKALATLKQNMKVAIDYGKEKKDISYALVFYIDSKKTIYVVDEAIKEQNPKHFEELENLKEVLE